MIAIATPLSIWGQLASFFFLCSGLFSDILVVRTSLLCAYTCLFLMAVLGSPLWPDVIAPGRLSLDGLIWSCLNLYALVSGITRLLLDEQHVSMDEDEEALWRMMYRLEGISRKVFKREISPFCKVVRHAKGQLLHVDKFFHITYKGTLSLDVLDSSASLLKTEKLGSGAMFDFTRLDLIRNPELMSHKDIRVTVYSEEAILFEFNNDKICQITQQPNLKSIFQTIFLSNLARIANYHYTEKDGFGCIQDDFVDPLYRPLEENEEPHPLLSGSGQALKRPFAHIAYSLFNSLSLPWPIGKHPIGLRHAALTPPKQTADTVTASVKNSIWSSAVYPRKSSVPDVEVGVEEAKD